MYIIGIYNIECMCVCIYIHTFIYVHSSLEALVGFIFRSFDNGSHVPMAAGFCKRKPTVPKKSEL